MKIALIQQHATKDKSANVARGLAPSKPPRATARSSRASPSWRLNGSTHSVRGEGFRDLAEPLDGPTVTAFQRKAKELGVVT